MPTLTAMKNGAAASRSQFSLHRTKSDPKSPENTSVGEMPFPTAVPAPPPQRPAPPPSKELPPPPPDQKPLPPKRLSKVPPRRELSKNAHNVQTSSPPALPVQLVQPPEPATQPTIQPAVAPSPVAYSPPQVTSPQAPSPQVYSPQIQAPAPAPVPKQSPIQPTAPQPVRPVVPSVVTDSARTQSPPQEYFPPTAVPPVTVSPAPPQEDDNETPLEDFIPTPDGAGSPLEPASSNEQPPLFTPPDMDPVAPPPLNVVHYNCFQEHRNMPTAQNVWCPLPCMTCHKADQEIRYRCVFCCLRICEGCHQLLQKCKNRSLEELMVKLHRA